MKYNLIKYVFYGKLELIELLIFDMNVNVVNKKEINKVCRNVVLYNFWNSHYLIVINNFYRVSFTYSQLLKP